jgi:polygalacturonase
VCAAIMLVWVCLNGIDAASGHFVANVADFGGVGNAKVLNTRAIEAAVAAINDEGGGTLYFPPGRWLTAPFNLTSNCVLLLDNAELLATPDPMLWSLIAPLPSYGQGRDHTPVTWERYTSFVHGFNLMNVSITTNSSGSINGQAYPWWMAKKAKTLCCTLGHLIEFVNCTDVEIGAPVGSPEASLILTDSPFWTVHLYNGVNAWVRSVGGPTIHAQNTDFGGLWRCLIVTLSPFECK